MISAIQLPYLNEVKNYCSSLFEEKFSSKPEAIAAVPARLELVGHHLDYLEGPTWCGAANIYNTTCMSKIQDNKIIMHAIGSEGEAHFATTYADELETTLHDKNTDPIFRYILAVIYICTKLGASPTPCVNVAMKLDIPYGAGLGSSAAICLGVLKCLKTVYGDCDVFKQMTPGQMIDVCKWSEETLGVSCGKLDMTAELSAKMNSIGVFDPNKVYDWVLRDTITLTGNYRFILLNFVNQKHDNRSTGLNGLVKEHDDLAEKLFKLDPLGVVEVKTPLCLVPEPILANPPEGVTMREKQLIRRCVSERKLVDDVTNMANAFTLSPEKLGRLLDKCYDNSVILGNVTQLHQAAHFIASHLKGVYGSKIHGAGFGGVMLLLVDPNIFGPDSLQIIHDFLNFNDYLSYGNIDIDMYDISLVEGVQTNG